MVKIIVEDHGRYYTISIIDGDFIHFRPIRTIVVYNKEELPIVLTKLMREYNVTHSDIEYI